MYHYAGNNPVRYTDPDGRSPLACFVPNPDKTSKEDARKWIENTVCVNIFGYLVCEDMYSKSMAGDSSDYVKESDSYIATVMSNDSDAYVNKTILKRLKKGITSGENGRTGWEKEDLKLALGSCSFSWELDSYNEETKTATVTVHITDSFDFNEGNGERSYDAEKLTALGRKAELTEYKVDVTYILVLKVKMSKETNE